MVKELCEKFDQGYELARYPYEMLDENKFLAARHGLEGTLVDLPDTTRVPTADLVRRVVDRLRPHAEELGSLEDLECIDDLLDKGQRRLPPGRGLRGEPRPPRGDAGNRREDEPARLAA